MRRRDFIGAVASSALGWPIAARAQQPIPVIGYLGIESPELFASRLEAFRRGLSEAGYDEGRNVAIEYRWANGHSDRLPALAAELVHRRVTMIAAPGSGVAALAAKEATTSIPVVFETGVDPVAVGLVKSLNRPGGNVTGVTSLNLEIGPKRLELMHELVRQARSFAVLVNPANLNAAVTLRDLEKPSRALGLQLQAINASTEHEIASAFAKLAHLQVGGLIIGADTFFHNRARELAALTLNHSMPAVMAVREFAVAGGLMSYGGSIRESHRQTGIYAGRVLKGEKPAELAVQRVTKVEFVINLKTAKTLGLSVSLPLLGRADEVIE
ncbi:MAG TPA: ABC transporter substrate-binding protein [Pseudolabrys sp.]